MIITKDDYIEMKVTMDQQATIKDFVNAIKPATTEINIDYYEELKANSDRWIEKETPHKPNTSEHNYNYCPKCKGFVEDDYGRVFEYCPHCGQKLDN